MSFRKYSYKSLVAFGLAIVMVQVAIGQVTVLTGNGYSGYAVTPSANVIETGSTIFTFEPNISGAKNTNGYNTQIGIGLYNGLELSGRLATNDQKCNMFLIGACSRDNIRDFSASIKWQLPIKIFNQSNTNLAFGLTDIGGASSFFRSYYVVGTKSWEQFEISGGTAKASGDQALLTGPFASVSYRPNAWSEMTLQNIGKNSWLSASVQAPLPFTQAYTYLSVNHRITDGNLTEKSWLGVGVSVPMDQGVTKKGMRQESSKTDKLQNKVVRRINFVDLQGSLEEKGFYHSIIRSNSKKLIVEVENTAYQWNVLDAAGVALGAVSGLQSSEEIPFDLVVKTRGIPQLKISAEAGCVRKWLEQGEVCSSLKIMSELQLSGQSDEFQLENSQENRKWHFRPELIVSPTVVSSIGTEYGAFDMDLGANLNLVLPLWAGATVETNKVVPLGVGTRGFEDGGVFYGARLKQVTNRSLFHQIISLPSVNTQLRLSAGNAYTNWRGTQLESSSQSTNGRHRMSLVTGSFKNNEFDNLPNRQYGLVSYRYANDSQMLSATEITKGKYWGGDSGWSIGERFWHGDTSINLYLRRSRMNEYSPLVSFAGIQVSLPITTRVNKSFESGAIRGVSQWTYTLESRVFDKTNTLTGGYGEVPRIGESLLQTFNRDRNSTRYLESNLLRVKSAFSELGVD